jgi:hypothetical protein
MHPATDARRCLPPATAGFRRIRARVPSLHALAVVLDLVEAGVHSGNSDRLTGVLPDLEEVARLAQPPILVAGLTSARPLLAHDREAEVLFAAALGQEVNRHPFLRARKLFSFGGEQPLSTL